MLKIHVLASSSKGNAVLVEGGGTRILIDAGISARRLTRRLAAVGVDPAALEAVFVSHEHGDHISGLRVFMKNKRIPLFMAPESLEASSLDPAVFHAVEPIEGGRSVSLGKLSITPFRLPHDAACTLGFILEAGGVKAALATDLGKPTGLLRERLKGCHCLMLEFNHDLDALMDCHYPLHIKMRIRSSLGHLSNDQAGKILRESVNGETRAVYLMHLSESNNHPALAAMAAREALESKTPVRVEVARPLEPTPSWEG